MMISIFRLLNCVSNETDKMLKIEKEKNEKRKAKSKVNKDVFPARDMFELALYRNKIIVIIVTDCNLADLYISKFKQGSGVFVEKAVVHSDSYDQHSLREACRSLAASVLINRTKILFVCDMNDNVSRPTATKLAYAFSAGLIWLKGLDLVLANQELENLNSQLPQKLCPSMSGFISVSSLFNKKTFSKTSSFNSLRQYTRYQRNVLTAFASVINRGMNFDAMQPIDVIGYNPEYPDAALLHDASIRFIDKDIEMHGLILPKLLKTSGRDKKMLANDRNDTFAGEYMLPDSQRKLNQIDSLMLNLSRTIIYIGSYPGTHLKNYRLHNWKIVFIDPKIDDEYKRMMLDVCRNASFENVKFAFNKRHLEGIINTHQLSGNIVIIDDSYSDSIMSYEHFQEMKLSFFESIFKDPSLQVDYVSVKCNLHNRRSIDNVIALLPQPHGGHLDELRLILGAKGVTYLFDFDKNVAGYMNDFKKLEISEKMLMIKYYHILLTKKLDAFKYIDSDSNVTLALYSITNTSNVFSDFKKYVLKMCTARKVLIFNAPNKGRILYMKKNKFDPGLNISIDSSERIVTFKSPSGRVWQDYCLTGKEALELGYIQITSEMLSGLLGPSYAGPGFMDNSAYSDMFNLYMPTFVFNHFLSYQHVGTGPISSVKSFSTAIRNVQPGISRSEYYKLRANLVCDVFRKYLIDESKYRLIGDEQCAVQIINDVRLELEFGTVDISASYKKPVDINISGHFLSLAITSHFIPVAIDAWMVQLHTMSQPKNANSVLQYLRVDPLLMFDNKISDDGLSFNPWHTKDELILTVEIVKPYLDLIMSGNYSEVLVDDIRESFTKLIYLST